VGQELAPADTTGCGSERWFPSAPREVRAGEVNRVDIDDDPRLLSDVNEFRGLPAGGPAQVPRGLQPLEYDGDVFLSSAFIFDGTFFRRDSRTVTSLKGTL
jgi:hypothetical protein